MATYTYNAVGTGTTDGDGTGDTLRTAFTKTNAMLSQLMQGTSLVIAVTANQFLASPSIGVSSYPVFRTIAISDLPLSGVTAGVYNSLTVNNKGLVTSATNTTSYCKSFRQFNRIIWSSTTQIQIPIGVGMRDSTNQVDMTVSSTLTVSITVNGANGLDTGAAAVNTWYYAYLISTGTTVAGLLSTVNESTAGTVTLPATYVYKRQIPTTLLYTAVSELAKFSQSGNQILFDSVETTAAANVVAVSAHLGWLYTSTTVDVTISTSLVVSPIADDIILAAYKNGTATSSIVADSTLLKYKQLSVPLGAEAEVTMHNPSHALKVIQVAASSLVLWVRGFYITKTIP